MILLVGTSQGLEPSRVFWRDGRSSPQGPLHPGKNVSPLPFLETCREILTIYPLNPEHPFVYLLIMAELSSCNRDNVSYKA